MLNPTAGDPLMPARTSTPETSSARPDRWSACQRLVRGVTLSRFQGVVGTMAALASLTGAGFSLLQFVRPANTGELVAIVQAAASRRSVTDATIEVLTPQNAIVATLTPDAGGRATQQL